MAFLYIDIETDNSEGFGLDPFRAKVVTFQARTENGSSFVTQDMESMYKLKDKIEDSVVVGHNIKFEAKFLKQSFGITLSKVYDTMIAEQIISGGQLSGFAKGKSLKDLVLKYCDVILDKTNQCSFKSGEKLSQDQIKYALDDVEYLPEIMEKQLSKIKLLGLEEIVNIEMKAIPAIAWLELSGISINTDKLEDIKQKVVSQKEEAAKILIKELVSFETQRTLDGINITKKLNLDSNTEVLKALRAKGLKLESTGIKELSKYSGNIVIEALKQYRQASKLLSSFINTMPGFINPETKRVHSSFNQYGALSGRLTSEKPNMQQQPSRFADWRKIFAAGKGNKIVSADYSQIELRIIGQLAQDPKYIRAYTEGLDLHKETASQLFKVPIEEVTKKQRSIAKSINFGLNYGMWDKGLQSKLKSDVGLDVTVEEAGKFIKDFQALYPDVTKYLNRASIEGLRKLQVTTRAGRYCKFHKPKDESEKGTIKRESKNLPVQGLCADIVKIAMGNLFLILEPKGIKFINTVHDELVFECKEEEAEEIAAIVKVEMEKAGSLFLKDLPCVSEVTIADYWMKD